MKKTVALAKLECIPNEVIDRYSSVLGYYSSTTAQVKGALENLLAHTKTYGPRDLISRPGFSNMMDAVTAILNPNSLVSRRLEDTGEVRQKAFELLVELGNSPHFEPYLRDLGVDYKWVAEVTRSSNQEEAGLAYRVVALLSEASSHYRAMFSSGKHHVDVVDAFFAIRSDGFHTRKANGVLKTIEAFCKDEKAFAMMRELRRGNAMERLINGVQVLVTKPGTESSVCCCLSVIRVLGEHQIQKATYKKTSTEFDYDGISAQVHSTRGGWETLVDLLRHRDPAVRFDALRTVGPLLGEDKREYIPIRKDSWLATSRDAFYNHGGQDALMQLLKQDAIPVKLEAFKLLCVLAHYDPARILTEEFGHLSSQILTRRGVIEQSAFLQPTESALSTVKDYLPLARKVYYFRSEDTQPLSSLIGSKLDNWAKQASKKSGKQTLLQEGDDPVKDRVAVDVMQLRILQHFLELVGDQKSAEKIERALRPV